MADQTRFSQISAMVQKVGGNIWTQSGNLLTNLGQFIWGTLGGRSFVLAMSALIFGFALAWRHSLTGDFVALVSAISALVHARAVLSDYHERALEQQDNGKKEGS